MPTCATISVLLPVYNSARYLQVAVDSILSQSFENFELLALDGGSSDGSLSILRKLAAQDRRIQILSRDNCGLVLSLNEMIEIAGGRYLARMDSDDICRPTRFAKQVDYLNSHPECVAVGSRSLFIDPQGMPICEHLNELAHDEIDSAHMSGAGTRICHPSVMMRREAVIQVGRYDETYRYTEDLDLFLRLAEIGKLANLAEVLIEYRHHLASLCYTKVDEVKEYRERAVTAARRRRRVTSISELPGPAAKAESSLDLHRKWAWWALKAGYRMTARKHAAITFALDPINIESARLFACAMRGY
jgi:glycosyltransferase involved in cell wall biosynthesis